MAQTFVGGIVPQKELSPGEEDQMGSTRLTPAVRKYTDNRGSTRVSNPFPDGFFSSIFGAENVDYGNILTPVQAERVEQARRNRFYSPDPVRKGFGSLFGGAEGEMTAFGPRETFVEPRSGIGSILGSFIPGANMLMDMASSQYAPPGAPQVMSGELVKPESGGIGSLTDILNKIFSPTSKALEIGANREGLYFPQFDEIFGPGYSKGVGAGSLSTLMSLENLGEKIRKEEMADTSSILLDRIKEIVAGIDPDARDPRRGKYIPDPTDNQVDNFMNNLDTGVQEGFFGRSRGPGGRGFDEDFFGRSRGPGGRGFDEDSNDPVKQANEAYMNMMDAGGTNIDLFSGMGGSVGEKQKRFNQLNQAGIEAFKTNPLSKNFNIHMERYRSRNKGNFGLGGGL